jgi:mono/diheme cytochrome c family protein
MRMMRPFLLAALGMLCVTSESHAADVQRGRYLAVLGDCAGCHTKPQGAAYAGGLPFNTPFGTIYSTNITSDARTGIGNWSEADFYRALHEGIAPGGKHLYPAFPYVYFARVTRADTDDLFAFLKTLKPVNQSPTPNRMTFPMNLRIGLIFWNWLYFDKTPPKVPADTSQAWKRGEYIVHGLGHCAACHTPKTALFGDQTGKPLAGALVDNWFANSLAGEKGDGLGAWTHADVVQFLKTGVNRHATAAGSMLEKVTSSTSRMTLQDLGAIASYLKSLPPQRTTTAEQPRREQMERGHDLYQAHCQTCHGEDGKERSGKAAAGYPGLAGDSLVMGRDPTTVLRIILTGGAAPKTPGPQPERPMPPFSHLDNGQVADMASYVRNAWGNRAPPVDATQVHNLRRALRS